MKIKPTIERAAPFVVFVIVGVLFIGFLISITLLLRESQSSEPELLFQKDGCNVYRFKDNAELHYFVKCAKTERDSTTYGGSGNERDIITEYTE